MVAFSDGGILMVSPGRLCFCPGFRGAIEMIPRTPRSASSTLGVLILCAVGGAAQGAAYRLSDHPSSAATPPPYGLRLDGLFAGQAGANGGITTFSFNTYGNTILRVIQNGLDLDITINGTVYGGEDVGAGVGFGAGDYQFSMTYTANVVATSEGWTVLANTGTNTGSLTALTGSLAGMSWNLFDVASGADTFIFETDDWRLNPANPNHLPFLGWHVGRGWLDFDGSTTSGTRDVLFVGHMIPSPLAGAMAGVGLMGVAARRRR
jgi:hypothetical protein